VPDAIKTAVEKAFADQFGMPDEDAVHRMAGAAEQSAINEKMVAHNGYLRDRVRAAGEHADEMGAVFSARIMSFDSPSADTLSPSYSRCQ